MYTDLLLYRNELKIKSVPKYKIIGITAQLLFSKKIFYRNCEIDKFLKELLEVEFKSYVLRSRTLIVAKTCKLIDNMDSYSNYQKKLHKFVCEKIEQLKKDNDLKEQKNEFDRWID